ncbi:M1 family metallopeptidase, partial [candidate division KSB1 bacterium]|nr:M1 family metallopeptidase [candidate division KSB1 bacterium]
MKTILSIVAMILTSNTLLAQQIETLQWRQQEALRKERHSKEWIASAQALTPNQQAYDVLYYDLQLKLDPQQKTIDGRVGIRALVLENGLDRVELDLHQQLSVLQVIDNRTGSDLVFERRGDLLIVHLAAACAQGTEVDLTVCYGGNPPFGGTFGSFAFDKCNGRDMIWSLSEPYGARFWWPCKDYPSDKADSVDIRITVPDHLIVASNGTLREVVETDGWLTYWWHEQYPITTYLVSVAIHPYTVYSDWFHYGESDSMQVQFYVFPENFQVVQTNYAKTVPMIEVLSDLYGLYPFIEEKYGHAEFVWGGGMEHQTITSLGGWSEDLIVHELAHMWWGDMITCHSFHHIWLNEGFAVYSEALWHENQYGKQALHNKMARERFFGPGTIFVENPETEVIFDGNLSYAKASWVLHMLRHWVGDSVFFDILHTYRERYEFQTATTEQFREVCEDVSGLDLEAYFQQWIYDEGFPVYEFLWESSPDGNGGSIVSGVIKQIQSLGPIFNMPIDVTVKMAGGDTTIVLYNDRAVQTFEFTIPQTPEKVLLDPEEWILRRVRAIDAARIAKVASTLTETSGDG